MAEKERTIQKEQQQEQMQSQQQEQQHEPANIDREHWSVQYDKKQQILIGTLNDNNKSMSKRDVTRIYWRGL